MAGLETHEIIPEDIQASLIAPILTKLSIVGVESDEGIGAMLNLLNNDSADFGLTQEENRVLTTLIARLNFIKDNTDDSAINLNQLEVNFYEILDEFKPIRDKVRAQIFRNIESIDIDAFRVSRVVAIPTNPITIPQPVVQDSLGEQLQYTPDGSTVGTELRYGQNGEIIEPSTIPSTPVVVPTTNEQPQTVRQGDISISSETIDEYKISLSRLRLYIESFPTSDNAEILDFIDTTISMLTHGDIIQLLNTTDSDGNLKFQGIIRDRLQIIKDLASKIDSGEALDGFTPNNEDHEDILNATQDQLTAFYEGLAGLLGVTEDKALEAWNNLSSYEKAIILDTGILPTTLSDTDAWDFEDFLNSNDFNEAGQKFDTIINQNSSLVEIISIGKGTLDPGINLTERYISRNGEVKSSDIRTYLEEIDRDNISTTSVNNIMNQGLGLLVGSYKTQANFLIGELDAITPDTSGRVPQGASLSISWLGKNHTFDNYEDKARYISTQLVLLEAMITDTDTLWGFAWEITLLILSLPGTVTENIGDFFNLESWGGLAALLAFKTTGYLFLSAMPIWGIIKLRANSGKPQSDSLIRTYKEGDMKRDFRDWVRDQKGLSGNPLTESEINNAIRLYNHNDIIDKLIIAIESNKAEGWKHRLEVLERFKKSSLMNLGDSAWKMMLEQRIVTTYTEGRLAGPRSWLHGIGRVNLRGGLDVNIRRGMDVAGSSTFEAKILRLLGINHPNFEKLLEDDSLKQISFDEAKSIRDNTLSRINSLPGSVAEKDIKRGLLRDYMSGLDTSKPIPERPFLYIMSEIFHNGDTTTVLAELKDRAIPSDFNLDTARSQFENPEAADIALENAKADLLKDINTDLPDGDIKDKLTGKAEKFADIDKLNTFKADVFEPVRDLLNGVRSIPNEALPTEIKDRITKSIYNALSITDTKGKLVEQTKEFAKLKGSFSKIEKITDDDIKTSFYEKIAVCFENDDDGTLAGKVSNAAASTNSILRSIDEFEDPAKSNLLEQFKEAIENLDPDNEEFKNIQEGLNKISEIQTTIKSPSVGMSNTFVDSLRTSLDDILGADNINWTKVSTVARSIETENNRINTEAGRPITPGAVPAVDPVTPGVIDPVDLTPTDPEVRTERTGTDIYFTRNGEGDIRSNPQGRSLQAIIMQTGITVEELRTIIPEGGDASAVRAIINSLITSKGFTDLEIKERMTSAELERIEIDVKRIEIINLATRVAIYTRANDTVRASMFERIARAESIEDLIRMEGRINQFAEQNNGVITVDGDSRVPTLSEIQERGGDIEVQRTTTVVNEVTTISTSGKSNWFTRLLARSLR